MKYKALLLLTLLSLAVPTVSLAAEETTKRRPDQAEFVTESHVRLTTENLTIAEIAEIKEATVTTNSHTSFWDYLTQSLAAFHQSLKAIFNLD